MTELKIAVEDSIFSLKSTIAMVTHERDSLSIKCLVHKLTKPSKFDKFEYGLILGIALVIATGWVLDKAW